jgi:hypothetical protein
VESSATAAALSGPAASPGPIAPASATAAPIIGITDAASVAGCRDLGEGHADTLRLGAPGRLDIRNALKSLARIRGASHVRYRGYAVVPDPASRTMQREYGEFYDCALRPVAAATEPVSASVDRGVHNPPGVSVVRDISEAGTSDRKAGSESPLPTAAIGGQFELLPAGVVSNANRSDLPPGDIATTVGVSGSAELFIGSSVAVGVNPGMVISLKGGNSRFSATQYDLRGRVRIGKLVDDRFTAHVYGSAGGSWIVSRDDDPTAAGPIFGFGAGVSQRLEGSTFVTFELGYQVGFQKTSVNSVELDGSSDLFHVAIGIATTL